MRNGLETIRTGSEVAFSLLRVLTVGYYLWGVESHLSLAELPPLLHVSGSETAEAVASLWNLNLIQLDADRHTVRLSPQAINKILVDGDLLC